jgi:hypothetical protein
VFLSSLHFQYRAQSVAQRFKRNAYLSNEGRTHVKYRLLIMIQGEVGHGPGGWQEGNGRIMKGSNES